MTIDLTLSEPGRHRHSRDGRGRQRGGTVLFVVKLLSALLSLALFVGIGYLSYTYHSLDRGLHRVALSNLGQTPTDAVKNEHTTDKAQNILVVGVDSRAGLTAAERTLLKVGNDQSTSTDTIMVIHVPADGSKATLISIPRDSYVDIPDGWAKNKINAAYSDASGGKDTVAAERAGENLLVKTVSDLTGLTINHYIQVGFGGFYTIAKVINGIDVNLCDNVDDTVSYNIAHGEGRAGSGFKMTAGHHHLNPVQSLEFVRQRHNLRGVGDDIGREQRQRYFLAQAFRQILSAGTLTNPMKLNSLVSAVKGAFVVDDGFTLQSLADQMIDLNGNNIVGQTIPTSGTSMVYIAHEKVQSSVVVVDPAKVRAWIQRELYPTATSASKPSTSTAAVRPSSTPTKSGLAKPAAGCIH
jgi:LCP family protein required for cell wall assembly